MIQEPVARQEPWLHEGSCCKFYIQMFYNRCALTCILKNKKENQINNSILNTSSVWYRPRGVVYNYAEKCCLQPTENGYRCVKTKINTAPKQFTTNAFSPVFWNDPLETICDLKLQPGVSRSWELCFPCPGLLCDGTVPSSHFMEHPELGEPWMPLLRCTSDERLSQYGATQPRPFPQVFWICLHMTNVKVRSLHLQSSSLLGWVKSFWKNAMCFQFTLLWLCAWHFIFTTLLPPPTSRNSLSLKFCCYYDPEEETECFYSRRRRRKVIVHLSLSFLALTQFYSFQVPFYSTEWRPWTCWRLEICGLCQLSWIWREGGREGREGKGTPQIQLSKERNWKVPESVSKFCLTDVNTVGNDGDVGIIFLAWASWQTLRDSTPSACMDVKGAPQHFLFWWQGKDVSCAHTSAVLEKSRPGTFPVVA